MNFFIIVLVTLIVFFSFKKSILLGILALILGVAYIIYILYPRFFAARGQQAFGAGDFENAKKYSERAYKRMNFNQRMSYAYMLIRMNEEEKALEILDAYIRLKGLDIKSKNIAKRQRSLAYYKLGRYEEALRDACDAYEAGYTTKTLYGLMGMLMLVLNKDLEKTTKFCEEAYNYDEDDRDIQDNMSICYYLQGDYEMAKEINGYVREENPEFLEGYYHGAQIAIKLKDYKTAKELLEKTKECKRTEMTTVSETAVKSLIDMVNDLIGSKMEEAVDTPVFTLKEAIAPPDDFHYEDEDSESIYDEYNLLEDEENNGESIYDELNALEEKENEV